MEKIDVDGTPFSILMDRAVKLKSSQMAHLRVKYDGFPSFYQNSIFPHQEVAKARELVDFNERLAAATRMKEDGNSAYKDGRLSAALIKYEMALAVFRFLENTNPSWKNEVSSALLQGICYKSVHVLITSFLSIHLQFMLMVYHVQGIKDEFMKEVWYRGKNSDECNKLNLFLVNCYNNIALVSHKMNDFQLAIRACDYAIEVDSKNDKSFFLRAQVRLAPKSSGAIEQMFAMSDLQTALKNNPKNNEAR